MYMNRVTLCGFLGADPKHTPAHARKEIVRFSLATTKRYKDGNEWKDRTQWHNCVVYGGTAKFPDTALQKGLHLLIEGELSYREYDRTIETQSGPINIK